MKVKPIGERVLIKPAKEQEKTAGGIYLPDTAREAKKRGEVEAVGTLKDGGSIPLEKGDIILYGGYSHEDFEIDGQEFVIVEFKDIVAKLE